MKVIKKYDTMNALISLTRVKTDADKIRVIELDNEETTAVHGDLQEWGKNHLPYSGITDRRSILLNGVRVRFAYLLRLPNIGTYNMVTILTRAD